MIRYRWGFYKTLEFMDSRRPDLEIRRNFFEQLKFLAERLSLTHEVSDSWDQMCSTSNEVRYEEILLMNTFLNSRLEDRPAAEHKKNITKNKKKKTTVVSDKKKRKIKWIDESHKNNTLETAVYALHPNRGPKLSFNPSLLPTKSILKYSDRDNNDDMKDNNEYINKKYNSGNKRPESSSLNRCDTSGNSKPLTSIINGNRPRSSQHHKSHDLSSEEPDIGNLNEQKGVIKRLLNEDKRSIGNSYLEKNVRGKPPIGLAQSNSFRKLDESKQKRGETPVKRELSEKEKKKITDSSHKQRDDHVSSSYTKPPTLKKQNDNKKIYNDSINNNKREPLKVESLLADSGMKISNIKDDSDIITSYNKKGSMNRSDIDDKDQINNNNSKNR